MKQTPEDKEREDRILEEIVVDCYGGEERAMGWYYYAADKIGFPFKARCVVKTRSSPLKVGDESEVIAMAPEEDCDHELMVFINWRRESLEVPLAQLEPVGAAATTRRVLEDWKYWVDRGYLF